MNSFDGLPGTFTPDHSGSRDEQAASATAPLTTYQVAYAKAKMAWNRDEGPIEKTVKAGEDLYFAAEHLIEYLLELNEELHGVKQRLIAALQAGAPR